MLVFPAGPVLLHAYCLHSLRRGCDGCLCRVVFEFSFFSTAAPNLITCDLFSYCSRGRLGRRSKPVYDPYVEACLLILVARKALSGFLLDLHAMVAGRTAGGRSSLASKFFRPV